MVNYHKNKSDSSVIWYSLNDENLEKARVQEKAIFLLIESDALFWSKQMVQDITTNERVIELLNERFIPIKVDRDARPDIERYYQKVHSLMNRQQGALPLNIFLTADLEPFYTASYIAPHAVDAQLGFEELLRVISKKYITDYATLRQKGQEVLAYINPEEESIEATKLNLNITHTILQHSQQLLDHEFGGFTKAPKFPNHSTLELLLDVYALTKEKKLLQSVMLTLDNMGKGGFYDLENRGFYHYAKDAKWKEPYRKKTTYDNALLADLYLRVYQITSKASYKKIALETIDFLLLTCSEQKLFALKDEVTICSWNALMVRTLFKAGTLDAKYRLYAIETLESLLSNFYVDGILFHIPKSNKNHAIEAFLEDYTQLAETLIIAYQETLDESFLIMATQFSNLLIEHYYQHGKWIYSNNKFQIRETIHDHTLPSSIASALSVLLSISSLVDVNYKKFVFKTLELHSYTLMRQPLSAPSLTRTMLRYLKDDMVIKANSDILLEHIGKRSQLAYPYLLFKNTEDNKFMLTNSHSTLATEESFEKLINHLESMV